MDREKLGIVVHYLRNALRAPARPFTDRELLTRYALHHDEAAFAALVERHGPLVWGVCRRILQHAADADDAFQATFLVLARNANSLGWQDSIANWLYGVACRTARKARVQRARRQHHELQAAKMPQTLSSAAWQELRQVLDEELDRLPAKYRAPLVLCYLEGKTRDEAAYELGWTLGALKGRLERGRDLLRRRLIRRGLTLSAALLSCRLSEAAVEAAVPARLAASVIDLVIHAGQPATAGTAVSAAVVELTKGVLRAMFLTKAKVVAMVACVFLAAGAGVLGHLALSGRPQEGRPPGRGDLFALKPNEQPEDEIKPAERNPIGEAVDRLRPYDVVKIEAVGFPADVPPVRPLDLIEPEGTVDLGPDYGKLKVAGLDSSEAAAALEKHLQRLGIKSPKASVTLVGWVGEWQRNPTMSAPYRIKPAQLLRIELSGTPEGLPGITGPHLVGLDGNVDLGLVYGKVRVTGLTLEEAVRALRNHLVNLGIQNPGVSVTLSGWETKWHRLAGPQESEDPALAPLLERLDRIDKRLDAMEKKLTILLHSQGR